MTTVYPVDAAHDAALAATTPRGNIDRAYRAALRHSRYVRMLRIAVLAGIAAVLLWVTLENYLPTPGGMRIPGEIGNLVIKGTKITMQQPKLTGFTADARPYEFTANAANQDINNPDNVELQQLHANLQMEDKSTVEMTAPSGDYDMKADKLVLHDDIALASSTGYAARLKEAVIDMRSGDVISDKPVWVKLLNGFLNAKRMKISENGNVIHFEGGVSMTLHPDQDKANGQ